MIKYLEKHLPVDDECRIQGTLRDRLESKEQTSRPPLKQILDTHRRGRAPEGCATKRGAKTEDPRDLVPL